MLLIIDFDWMVSSGDDSQSTAVQSSDYDDSLVLRHLPTVSGVIYKKKHWHVFKSSNNKRSP